MHLEILIEDISGKRAMEILLPRLLEDSVTYRVHSYKGIGHLPKGLKPKTDASKRILLSRLPQILQGYGNNPSAETIVVICDLDDRDKHGFIEELNSMLSKCNPRPDTIFCLAIEEFEAWYLGDLDAVRKAYPKAKNAILRRYENDQICGTWELLADAIHMGGSRALVGRAIGEQKSIWATKISIHMNVENNASPSFCYMRDKLREKTTIEY